MEARKKVVILGAGPGGYVAAIRAAQLGAEVTVIEKNALGGVCLNVGCIPTKVLLHTAEVFTAAKEGAMIGLKADNVDVDWDGLMARKKAVVDTLVGGVGTLLRSNAVRIVEGEASFVTPKEIAVTKKDGSKESVPADAVIVATGSEPVVPPVPGFDLDGVITSTGALSLERLPKSVVLVGGGVIGMEFASIFASFGVQVTVVEMLPEILPMLDGEIVQILKGVLLRKGVAFHTNSKVVGVEKKGKDLAVRVDTPAGPLVLDAEKVLVSVGRRPVTKGLGLDRLGIAFDGARVKVNSRMETSLKGIYAIGDCASHIMLAHVASREGEVAVENMMGQSVEMDYTTTPGAIYTSPEIATVGLMEKEAAQKGLKVKVGRFPLMMNGKSLITGDTSGVMKVIADESTRKILGVQMVGGPATDMIAEGALALHFGATPEDILHTIHAHPTVSESMAEAAANVFGLGIHTPKA